MNETNPYSSPQEPEPRAPRAVKYLGLFWIRPRTYFVLQAAAFLALCAIWICWAVIPAEPWLAELPLYKMIPYVVAIGIIAEIAETFLMIRKFRKAARESR